MRCSGKFVICWDVGNVECIVIIFIISVNEIVEEGIEEFVVCIFNL